MSEKTQNKVWITVGTFSTFEEADAKRNDILNDHTAVRVRCDGRYRKSFRVRVWDIPQVKDFISEVRWSIIIKFFLLKICSSLLGTGNNILLCVTEETKTRKLSLYRQKMYQ